MFTHKVFQLTDDQYIKINEWANTHNCSCRLPDGRPSRSCCGGEISITFTPSAIGTFITAKCICGDQINIK